MTNLIFVRFRSADFLPPVILVIEILVRTRPNRIKSLVIFLFYKRHHLRVRHFFRIYNKQTSSKSWYSMHGLPLPLSLFNRSFLLILVLFSRSDASQSHAPTLDFSFQLSIFSTFLSFFDNPPASSKILREFTH